jgi:hypothetical protein
LTEALKQMRVKFNKKFTDKELDEFIDKIYANHQKLPSDKYYFDLADTEFIGNQELLLLSGLFKSFIESNISFEVEFFKKETPASQINPRVKRQIIQFWNVWKIWKIAPDSDLIRYFGIDGNAVERLQDELNYFPKLSEIYTRHGVTPFITLDYINNYDETQIQKLINPIYKLNSVIEDLLKKNSCHHPFTSNSLSSIITEELYLNFLDHSISSSFQNWKRFAFMSISFQAKLDESKSSYEEIQKLKALNFQSEALEQALHFFYDSNKRTYKNIPYIQFSFLDFGQGICKTLKEEYQRHYSDSNTQSDSDILIFSFKHNSSRHSIDDEKNIERFIPRGLFDVVTVVRRYKGILVVRSNYGKVLFDFSNKDISNSTHHFFGKKDQYFPGTLISLYIPAIEDIANLNTTTIKPEVSFSRVAVSNRKYVSLNSIANNLAAAKKDLYSNLLSTLRNKLAAQGSYSLIFLSFKGCTWIEKKIIKKILYFLLSDYNINHLTNVILLNSPNKSILEEIENEIPYLNEAIKNYKLHPLPILDYDTDSDEMSVKWLGVYNNDDKDKLNQLLFDQYSIARSDFTDPSNVVGHLNEFDSYGNLLTNLPSKSEVSDLFKNENDLAIEVEIKYLLTKHNCIKENDNQNIYLCSGNYYQREYIDLNNLVSDKLDCQITTKLMYEKIKRAITAPNEYKFIAITTTSQKLLKSLTQQGLLKSTDCILLDSAANLEEDLTGSGVDAAFKYMLICDVLSSGSLTTRVNNKLNQLGLRLHSVAVVISILDRNYEPTKIFLESFHEQIIYLTEYSIKKLSRSEIINELRTQNIIRINPHTHIPITLSVNETNFKESVIFESKIEYDELNNEIRVENKFLSNIKSSAINVGFLKYNNLIHPYFFNTRKILTEISERILHDIFKKINKKQLNTEKVKAFYPRKSGIEFFSFDLLKKVLSNHAIEEIEIERFGTTEGWRFPHNTDYLSVKVENNICFILDDGTCSGDSLIQMIDEIAFYNAKEIILLCFVGRINDHKREFFSRLRRIQVKDGATIPLSIYFASHWHIPTYYIDENPNTREITWLDSVINFQNAPQSIRKIAKNIIKEIKPKNEYGFKDHKYLPTFKGTNNIIPKKDLLIVRNEIGKVTGYRLYKESFIFFDYFIKKYDTPLETSNRYKEIELLCSALIYEPYLYEKIAGILPDVIDKIEAFVRALIFQNSKINDKLTYEWNKKDIIHLFFIVFKNDKLLREVTESNFKSLLEFTGSGPSAVSYILYKLLIYFPLNEAQLKEKKFDVAIKDLLDKFKGGSIAAHKEIRKFYHFITTLPSRDDFDAQLSIIKDNYNQQKGRELHDDKISFNHNISLILTLTRQCIIAIDDGGQLETEKIETLRDRWFEILNFINPILRFSISFKEYLLPSPYFRLINKVESGNSSLRWMVGINEEIIFNLNESFNDIDKLKLLEKNIVKIQNDYKVNSDFYRLIDKRQTNLKDLINGIIQDINSLQRNVQISSISVDPSYQANIPESYSSTLIRKELITNLKNHSNRDKKSKIIVACSLSDDSSSIELKIVNEVSPLALSNGNGEGIKCLMLLSQSDLFGFRFEYKTQEAKYIQNYTFNIH